MLTGLMRYKSRTENLTATSFRALSTVYKAVPAATALSYLGLSHPDTSDSKATAQMTPSTDIIDRLTAQGWRWDPEKGVFYTQQPQQLQPRAGMAISADSAALERAQISSVRRLVDLVGFVGGD